MHVLAGHVKLVSDSHFFTFILTEHREVIYDTMLLLCRFTLFIGSQETK